MLFAADEKGFGKDLGLALRWVSEQVVLSVFGKVHKLDS